MGPNSKNAPVIQSHETTGSRTGDVVSVVQFVQVRCFYDIIRVETGTQVLYNHFFLLYLHISAKMI